jgi:GT2 family glycosyltransferase
MTDIAVAIVNWNARDHLRRCLSSALAERPVQCVVVDNGSTDGSADVVAREFPAVDLLVDTGNPGYGAASNRAMARCTAPYVLLLNSDTVLRPGALGALAGYLDRRPRAGLVGPRLVNPDGTLQRSCYPFPRPLLPHIRTTPLARLARLVPVVRDRYVGTWPHTYARRVPWVVGAALAIRRDAFDAVGGFDQSFYMYFEEVDLAFRLRAAGWETHFAPVTDVVHVGGVSSRQVRAAMLAHWCLSSMHFYRQHYRGLPRAQAVTILRGMMMARLVRDTVRYHLARDARERARLGEDRAVWWRALRGVSGAGVG